MFACCSLLNINLPFFQADVSFTLLWKSTLQRKKICHRNFSFQSYSLFSRCWFAAVSRFSKRAAKMGVSSGQNCFFKQFSVFILNVRWIFSKSFKNCPSSDQRSTTKKKSLYNVWVSVQNVSVTLKKISSIPRCHWILD